MDNGPPDSKRSRIDSSPWQQGQMQHHRLPLPPLGQPPGPPPQQFSPPPPTYPPRQMPHPEERRHIEPEDPLRVQPIPPHVPYGPYGPPREPQIKVDPSSEPSQLQHRPHSTGTIVDTHVRPPGAEDPRRQSMAGYEEPTPQSATQPYMPAPPFPGHPPPPQAPGPGPYYDRPPYEAPAGYSREQMYADVQLSGSISAQRKKNPRTSQACEACRAAKAKCDDPKPCTSCRTKGITCNYDPPVQKQGDKAQAEILSRLDALVRGQDEVARRQEALERALLKRNPALEIELKRETSNRGGIKEEGYETTQSQSNLHRRESTSKQQHGRSTSTGIDLSLRGSQQLSDVDEDAEVRTEVAEPMELEEDLEEAIEDDEDDEHGKPVLPDELSIPVGHTTGAAKLLQWPAISQMVAERLEKDKFKGDPFRRENKRGLIRLYGRGEGTEIPPGYEKDPMTDFGSEGTPDDNYSESSSSPSADYTWGQVGGLSPAGNITSYGTTGDQRMGVDLDGLPDLNTATVLRLADSYMKKMNIMHPILVPKRLQALLKNFLKHLPESQSKPQNQQPSRTAGFVGGMEIPGTKRKRSPTIIEQSDNRTFAHYLKPGRPQRSISVAIVLLVLALGSICEEKVKVPDVVRDPEPASTESPSLRNGVPSPVQTSPATSASSMHSSGLPSPRDADRPRQLGRRDSTEGVLPNRVTLKRNLDVIPGLSYFAIATDIIGNQVGGNSLQHVHACLLAGLYQGQLARVLESHSYIFLAGRALQVILQPKLERLRKFVNSSTGDRIPARDNPLVFAFWTCLQLESDILAELDVPQSHILALESSMPWPNLEAAVKSGEMTTLDIQCYSAQLWLRKHLNSIHKELYAPGKEDGFQLRLLNHHTAFPIIESLSESLKIIDGIAPLVKWNDSDPPSDNILVARLRGKYYGAQMITYRLFLKMVINYQEDEPGNPPRDQISPVIIRYAEKCIRALENSTRSFHGIKDGRLIVTNVWGTAHAQWGNILALQAAYLDPILKPFIKLDDLKYLTNKTRAFLFNVAHPTSALYADLKILDHVAKKTGMTQEDLERSFSSGGSASTAPTPYAAPTPHH